MTYERALEVAQTTFNNLSPDRWRFRDGVVEAAARAATGRDGELAVDAIERVFFAHRIGINPNWDGVVRGNK